MGKAKRKVANKSPSSIHYKDRYNYVEIAATIIEQVNIALESEHLLGEALNSGSINMHDFAETLEALFDSKAVDELLNSQLGRGLLFGMYLQITSQSMESDEQEVLDEMDV